MVLTLEAVTTTVSPPPAEAPACDAAEDEEGRRCRGRGKAAKDERKEAGTLIPKVKSEASTPSTHLLPHLSSS
jgi:hypothetical protein